MVASSSMEARPRRLFPRVGGLPPASQSPRGRAGSPGHCQSSPRTQSGLASRVWSSCVLPVPYPITPGSILVNTASKIYTRNRMRWICVSRTSRRWRKGTRSTRFGRGLYPSGNERVCLRVFVPSVYQHNGVYQTRAYGV